MQTRVDYHFKLENDMLCVVDQKRINKVWLSSNSQRGDFSIEFSPHHLDILRELITKLEEADQRMQSAENLSAALEAERYYNSEVEYRG